MTGKFRAVWRTEEEGSYDTTSYNLIEGIGEGIADILDIKELEVHVVPANNHSFCVGTREEMKSVYNEEEPAPTLEDIKNIDGSNLMHLRNGQPTHDIEGILTTAPHEQERSSQYIWLTTDPSNIVYDKGRRDYEPSLNTEYEARLSLSSHPIKTKTEENEVDSTMNKIKKMLGREPDLEERKKVVESGFEGILESPYPRTEEIAEEIDLKNAKLY